MQGTMNITDHTGHSTLVWDTTTTNRDPAKGPLDPSYVAQEFDRLASEGHLTYGKVEGQNEVIRRFDATLPEITVTRPLVGG